MDKKNCLTCDNLDTSHFYRSTITGRVYHINFNQLSCKSKNVIYLLTCLGCLIQYTGETRQEIHCRNSGHRISATADIGTIKGNKLLCLHFSQNAHCRSSGYKIQIIHKLPGDGLLPDGTPDPDMTLARKALEREYMVKLRTCYPYGLNDRFLATDLMNNISNLNVFNYCFKNLESIQTSNGSPISNNTSAILASNLKFNNELEFINFISNCPCPHLFPCMEMFSVIQFLANSSIKKNLAYKFIKLITHKLFTRIDNNLNQQFLYACLDIFNYKFNNYNQISKIKKFAPKLVLKIKFSHKIIELINLSKLIHSKPFIDLFPFPQKLIIHLPWFTYIQPL